MDISESPWMPFHVASKEASCLLILCLGRDKETVGAEFSFQTTPHWPKNLEPWTCEAIGTAISSVFELLHWRDFQVRELLVIRHITQACFNARPQPGALVDL